MAQKIEDKVQKWLSDIGIFRQKVPDDNTNFHFIINYPEENVMDVIQPKGASDLIVTLRFKKRGFYLGFKVYAEQ